MNDMRKKFEKWAVKNGIGAFIKGYEPKFGYSFMEVQTAWESWQACQKLNSERIAKLEAKLNKGYVLVPIEPSDDDIKLFVKTAFDAYNNDCNEENIQKQVYKAMIDKAMQQT